MARRDGSGQSRGSDRDHGAVAGADGVWTERGPGSVATSLSVCGLLQRLFQEVRPTSDDGFDDDEHGGEYDRGSATPRPPLGLRAMRDLESLTPRPASLRTRCAPFWRSTQLGPMIPAQRSLFWAAAGSARPTVHVGTAIFRDTCAATVAVVSANFSSDCRSFGQCRREPRKNERGRPSRTGLQRDAEPQSNPRDKLCVR